MSQPYVLFFVLGLVYPVHGHGVMQVCIKCEELEGLYLWESGSSFGTIESGETRCMTGAEAGKHNGEAFNFEVQARGGVNLYFGSGSSYDGSSSESANYECSGPSALKFSCDYQSPTTTITTTTLDCPGGFLSACIEHCPTSPEAAFNACVTKCGDNCLRVLWGSQASASPEDFGISSQDVVAAEAYLNMQVNGRQCLLFAKDGKIIYETYSGVDAEHLFEGYSMTKSVGAMLVLYAASEGFLDLDADITAVYGIPSPREYAVTTRLILTQIISADEAPGQMWEYDALGTKWLYLLPHIMLAASGESATKWFNKFKKRLEFSESFSWDNIEDPPPKGGWHMGAVGTCSDWARFGQLIASGGFWGDDMVYSQEIIQDIGRPQKAAPYNYFPNTCWGHGFWLNSDKEKYPGCCWEASRLVPPMCGSESFMTGAPTDLVMLLGLKGLVVLAVPSVNAVIASFGEDMRPLEPARQGVWPAFCTILGLGCNVPEPVPVPKCGEELECLGLSAQCYNGFEKFSHKNPGKPAGDQCVQCLQQRSRIWADTESDLAEVVLKDYCKFSSGSDQEQYNQFKQYVRCFCYDGDNPFVWPTTTTTTPAPGPEALPPHVYTTTTGPRPANRCNIDPTCNQQLSVNCNPSHFAAGCGRAAVGDVAPSAGVFTSDDGGFSGVQVSAGQVANTTGMFCPQKQPAAKPTIETSVNLRGATSADSVAASLFERASLQSGSGAVALEGATSSKCYKCLENMHHEDEYFKCPLTSFGYETLMFCWCDFDV